MPGAKRQEFYKIGARFSYLDQDIKVRRNRQGMGYLKVTCWIRNKVEVAKHYDTRGGAPGMPRKKKRERTPEEVARQNAWRRCRDLRRLIELNFGPGDWHITLTCRPEERPSAQEAPKRIREFRNLLRSAYKKKGWIFKYLITCETGERGAVHWHMIINDMHDGKDSTAALVRKLWTLGRVYFSPLDGSGDYAALAEYIVKESSRRIERGKTGEKLSYMASRNLIRPVERTEKVNAKSWRKQPKIKEGWELVPGTLVNGINKYTGLPYQHYTVRRKEETGGKSRHLHRDKPAGTGKGNRQDGIHHADPAGRADL